MSPYDIPASVVKQFVTVRLWNCLERLDPQTVDDIICISAKRLLLVRNMGSKTLAECRELQGCLIHDIDHFVRIAAEEGLIDLREIVQESNGLVSAPYKLIDPTHSPEVHQALRHVLNMQRVASLQDILLFSHVGYEMRTLNKQPELATLKRTLLEPAQEQILKARNDGGWQEQEVLTTSVQKEMLRSAILIETVPLHPSHQLGSVFKQFHVSTLLELQHFKRIPMYLHLPPETHRELTSYKQDVETWLGEGRWTSLNFFPK